MTPDEWSRLSPQQQAAHVAQYGPPPPAFVTAAGYALASPPTAMRRTNVWAIVSGACALVGLFVLPLVLCPVAVVSGIVGYQIAYRERDRMGGQRLSAGGIVLGLIGVLALLGRAGML